MKRLAPTHLALVALLTSACEQPTAPTVTPEPLRSAADDVRVVAMAMGDYQIGALSVVFNAIEKGDASVKGQAEFHLPVGDVLSEVICLTIVDDVAWIGLRHVQTNVWFVSPGSFGWFRVRDDGEGGVAADESSVVLVNRSEAGAKWYCANTPDGPALNSIAEGNVQVRPR